MNLSKINLSLGVALASSTIAFAQNDPELPATTPDQVNVGDVAPPGGLPSIISRAHGASVKDGVIVGGGADYKATFDNAGMTYVPALGKSTRAMPFRFEVQSFRRGETLVHNATNARPTLNDGYVATYARGNGIIERFDVNADGVELSYVFPQKVPGTGDLIVRGRVNTALEGRIGEHLDGMRFWKKQVGGVTIGDVTGIDALGDRVSGSLRWDGTNLDLVLPAAFVDSATYPLVLDPIVGTTFDVNSDVTDWNDTRPDAAFDATFNCYLVVWQREFGVNDVDIRGQLVDNLGVLNGPFRSIQGGADVDMRPTVCNINNINTFVVSYQTALTEFGPFDIACTTVAASDGSIGGTATIASTTANEINPDSSGERISLTSRRDCIVVWEAENTGIRASEVNVPGVNATPVPGPIVTITSGSQDELPAISKSGGSVGRHAIVWQRSATFTRAALVDNDLTILDSFNAVGSNAKNADVDGNGTNFMVVFERFESGLAGSRDVYCQMMEWDGSSLVNVGAATPVEEGVADDEFDPAVGFTGPKYVVVWSDGLSGFLRSNIIGRAIGPNCEFCGDQFGFSALTYDIEPQVATRWASGETNDEALIVNSAIALDQLFASNVTAVRFEAVGAGGTVTDIGGGCGSGGSAAIVGAFALGNTVRINLTGTSGSLVALHIGLPGGSFACGSCQVTNPFITFPITLSGGNGTFALPLACTGFDLIGGQWEIQFVSGFTPATPCPFAPTVSFSNRVEATFGL